MTSCDCPVCSRVEAYRAAPSITRRPSQRDRITHAQHIIMPYSERNTTTKKEPDMKPILTGPRCREYLGRAHGGYCGAPAVDGLCPTHTEQRRGA